MPNAASQHKVVATDERINALTHGLGAALSAVGGGWLVASTMNDGVNAITLACLVYAVTLVALYVASTLSHCFVDSPVDMPANALGLSDANSNADNPWRRKFRALDQACIYLLIVGTYTPFSIAYLNSTWWNSVLSIMWVLAIGGFVSKLFFAHRVDKVSIWIYVLLGWIPALAGMPFNRAVPDVCMAWLVGGGAVYTIGTYFLFNDDRATYYHGIWHTFVLTASAMHFYAVTTYVVWR